ncbi:MULTISPECIES: DUF6435 family protein [unclassified Arsukibacterium]|uniref:DUF6435 family protein n=1 Tax=unclassified Arsukibacterium TaxID=2635278 RepID=UPI000C5DFF54|nr:MULTISPECIES: DUF6435 family protein [unclassified Arsukibacterium]MAA96197.1 hypothetical protein [Rheinheimera sp.]MBM35056.1 hypothetical protein [Rheinheimera sp.]HAW92392.1 hypothetical protein [Candidatus Azambacteria bacterium]|tara:strand:- start:1170 stop:1349 length:180 start_codon:yes stop_codon:yes gene_type:complete
MFGFLKPNPEKKLRKAYDSKLEQAMHAQRNGDMRLYADLTEQSEKIWQQLTELKQTGAK